MKMDIDKNEAYLLALAIESKMRELQAYPAPLADGVIQEYSKLYEGLEKVLRDEKK